MKRAEFMVMPISTECRGSGEVFEHLVKEGLFDATKTVRRKGVGKFKIIGQVIVGVHKDKEKCTMEGAANFFLKTRKFCEARKIESVYLYLKPFASDGLDGELLVMTLNKVFAGSSMEVQV